MKKLILLLTIPSLFISAHAASPCVDIQTFKNLSLQEKKPLLLYFTDKDRCEVIEAKEFVEKIENTFVFAKINLDELQEEEREKIRKNYNLRELPRLVLFDEEGDEIGRYGIYGEAPENMAAELLAVIDKHKTLCARMKLIYDNVLTPKQLEELYTLALELKKDVKAAQILDVGLKHNNLFFYLEKYRFMAEKGEMNEMMALRKTIEKIDPFNENEGHFSLAMIDFQTHSAAGSKEAVHFLERYLEQFGERDNKNRWRVEMMVAQYYLNYDNLSSSLQHAETAFKEAPQDVKEEIGKCCNYIKNQLEQAIR